MRTGAAFGLILAPLFIALATDAAPPNVKPAQAAAKTIDSDNLPAGQFTGTLVSMPDSERLFSLKVNYPEVRLKPGARIPNLQNGHAQNMNRGFQQILRLQQQLNRGTQHHHAIHNMVQMQQAFLQMQVSQERAKQSIARIQQQKLQQELKMLRQEIQAIQNLYQVVKVTREITFQADPEVKVRIKDLPKQFDEKGNIKKYTREELTALKGKDKNLMGYESSLEALKSGQSVLVILRAQQKPQSTRTDIAAGQKDKDDEKEDKNASIQHKMQAKVIVIFQNDDALSSSAGSANNLNKK
jgi:hypothetical protein